MNDAVTGGSIATAGAPSALPLQHEGLIADAAAALVPRPSSIEETGLSEAFLSDLAIKHLYRSGVLDLHELMDRLALASFVLDPVIAFLRNESYVEVLQAKHNGVPRYALTDRGRRAAIEAFEMSGYAGPAPVPLDVYRRVVHAQSVRSVKVTRNDARNAFKDVVARPGLIDRLGTALNSGRAVFLYGPAGTGKTFLGSRMVRMLSDHVLVPYAVMVDERVLQFFDPSVHRRTDEAPRQQLMLNEGYDARFVRCRRPEVVAGGELTLDMLEVEYDSATRQYHAPQQFVANNGLYMIDDLGRQRVTVDALLNRWITPMEEGRDFLTLGAGQRFEVPFDVILIFSTNLNPLDLADEAFLRRLGHKVRFDYVDAEQYGVIWQRTCAKLGLDYDRELLRQIFGLYRDEDRPLLPCHPRDLLSSVVDRLTYEERSGRGGISVEQLREAWNSYFVSLDKEQEY